MAWGSGKQTREELLVKVGQLEAEVKYKQDTIDRLERDKSVLLEDMKELRKAFIAKQSPTFYMDQKMDEAMKDPELRERIEKERATNKVLSEYANAIEDEQHIKSVDDLMSMFTKAIGPPVFDRPASASGEEG